MISRLGRQYRINELIKEILQKNMFSGTESVNIKEYVEKCCERLVEIFDNGNFRPHYFEVSQFLLKMTDSQYQRTSTVKLLIESIQECLKNGFNEKASTKHQTGDVKTGIQQYYADSNFRYDVDMFFAALMHEIIIFELRVSNRQLLNNQVSANMLQQRMKDTAQDVKEQVGALRANIAETSKKIEETHNTTQETSVAVAKMLTEVEVSKENVKDAVSDSKEILPNLLAIMGIFVAIIIAVVAVYLSLVLNTVAVDSIFSLASSLPKRIMLIMFLCALVFNLLFVFVYWIAKLANKSIGATCMDCKDSVCSNQNCKFFKRIWKRYWYFILVNLFFVIVFVVSSLPCWEVSAPVEVPKTINESTTDITYNDKYNFNGTVEVQQDANLTE